MTIYKLPLDDILDKDIIDWIATFPRNRKAEYIRQVLRNHMYDTSVPVGDSNVVMETVKESQPTIVEETQTPSPINRFSNATDSMGITAQKPNDKLRDLF